MIKVDGKPVYEKKDTRKSTVGVTSIISHDKDGKIITTPFDDSARKLKNASVDKSAIDTGYSKALSKKAEDEIKEVDYYNNTLYDSRSPELEGMTLLGNKVLIRLYKLQKFNRSTLIRVGGRKIEQMSRSELTKTLVEAPDETQFQERGVIVKIGVGCSDMFKNNVKEGMVVDIAPHAFNPRNQRWLTKETVVEGYDNYFLVGEFDIEFIFDPAYKNPNK